MMKAQISLQVILLFTAVLLLTSGSKTKPEINKIKFPQEFKSLQSSFTLRSLLSSSSTALMNVKDSSGIIVVNTTNVSPVSTDSMCLWIDTGINWSATTQTFVIPPNEKHWIVPFNGNNPIQIADLGGGGSGGSNVCHKLYCPCQPGTACENKCFPRQGGVDAQGRIYWVCTKTVGGNDEPCKEIGCDIKICKVSCSGGVIISSSYTGPAFIIKADLLLCNGVLY